MTSSGGNQIPAENNIKQETSACSICKRKFIQDRLPRHLIVCEKQAQKRRNIFDSSRQRTPVDGKGETLVSSKPAIAASTKSAKAERANNDTGVVSESKKANWREAHEEFIKTVRKARGLKVEEDDNVKKIPVGYVKCPFCERTFNKAAGERHIAWCKEQKARIPRSSSQDAINKLKARSQYKGPKARKGADYQDQSKLNNLNDLSHQSNKKSQRFRSPTRNETINGIKSRLRLDEVKPKQAPKTVIMKFKEKFPNHAKSEESITTKILKNTENIKDILKRPDSFSGPSVPKTVPGVRTRGLSPLRVGNRNVSLDQIDFDTFKSRIEDVYNNRMSIKMMEKGIVDKTVQSMSQNGSRSSTPRSSDGNVNNVTNTVDTKEANETINDSLPRFCHQCGTKYPLVVAKYCHECGARRLGRLGVSS